MSETRIHRRHTIFAVLIAGVAAAAPATGGVVADVVSTDAAPAVRGPQLAPVTDGLIRSTGAPIEGDEQDVPQGRTGVGRPCQGAPVDC
jgi:hypothetical protein